MKLWTETRDGRTIIVAESNGRRVEGRGVTEICGMVFRTFKRTVGTANLARVLRGEVVEV